MSTLDRSLDTLQRSDGTIDEVVWRPSRTFGVPLRTLDSRNRIQKLQSTNTPQVTTPGVVTVATGVPKVLLTITATESPDVQQGRTFSEVSVVFSHDPADKAYDHVNIWFQGYKGNAQPVLMTSGITSPITFLTETTKEVVTVFGQVVGANGSALSALISLSTTVELDGVVSAPPAPTAGTLLSTPVGFQFSFTLLSGLLADVIDSYRIYRSTTSSFGAATLIQTIKHSPTNSGDVVVQDQIEQYQTRWYWVSAVSTSGLESSATLVGTGVSGAVAQGGAGDNLVYNGDFSIFTPPTGTANSLESAARVDDGGTPNGWCRNFESGGAGEGVFYRVSAGAAGMPSNGAWCIVIQDATAGGNANFGVVSDAFPVIAGSIYYFSALFGFNAGIPSGGQWYWRIIYYKQGTTDFSTSSADRITSSDIVSASTNAATARYAKALKIPVNCGFVRMVFYHWGATSSQWNMLVSDVRCTNITSSQQVPGVYNAGTFTATNILSNASSSHVINVAANTIQFGFGQVGYNSGSVDPGSFGTWYIYAVDEGYTGGAVTYLATSSFVNVNAQDWAAYFGKITTVSGGGTGGGGSGGGGGCFTGNVEIKTPSGIRRFDSLPRDERFLINTEFGVRPALLVVHENYSADMLDMGDEKFVTLTHGMKFRGSWRHAVEHFEGCPVIRFEGTVYNLHVCDPDPLTHHYILASGEVAHNFFKT